MSNTTAASALLGGLLANNGPYTKMLAEKIAASNKFKSNRNARRTAEVSNATFIESKIMIFPESCIKDTYEKFDEIEAGIDGQVDLDGFLIAASEAGAFKFEPFVYMGATVPVLVCGVSTYFVLFRGEIFELHQSLNWDQRLHQACVETAWIRAAFEQSVETGNSDKKEVKHWDKNSKAFGILMYMNLISTFGVYDCFMDLLKNHTDVVDKFMYEIICMEGGEPVTYAEVCAYDLGSGISLNGNPCPVKIIFSDNKSYARLYLTLERKFYVEVIENGQAVIHGYNVPAIEEGLTTEQISKICGDSTFLAKYYNSATVTTLAVVSALTRLGYYSDSDGFYADENAEELQEYYDISLTVNAGIEQLDDVIRGYYG